MWKSIVGGMVCWGAAASCMGAWDGFHAFTDTQGRAVSAKIVNFDAQRGWVELELENKQRKKVDPAVFSADDQAYIKDWSKAKSLLSTSGLRFAAEKKVVEDWSENTTGINREFEKVVYDCVFKNGSADILTDLTVDYCVYWMQEEGDRGGGEVALEKDFSGSFTIDRLEPRGTATCATEPVVLLYQHLAGGYYYSGGQTDKQSSKMKGVWLKVSMQGPGGETVVRDFCEPADVMKRLAWKAPVRKSAAEADDSEKAGRKKKKRKD